MRTIKNITVCGVGFTFRRVANFRNNGKHWEVSVSESGTVLECFPGKTLEEKIYQIETTARIVGAEKFKSDLAAA